MDEQLKNVVELLLALIGTVITWKLALSQLDVLSQIILGFSLLGIVAVLALDLYQRNVARRKPRLDVRKVAATDLDGIENAIREGFEVKTTIGTTVFLVKENY
jgi:hypothetical protein